MKKLLPGEALIYERANGVEPDASSGVDVRR